MKIVVSNPETGKTYQKEIEEDQAKALHRKRIGQEIQGSLIDLNGYTLKITGGSDKQGFPMRKGIDTAERKKVLLTGGTGYNQKRRGMKKRKTVRGEIISNETEQINLKTIKTGKKKLPVAFGLEEPEEEQEETKEEKEEQKEEQKETKEEETSEKQDEEPETEPESEDESEQEEQKETKEKEQEEAECPECGETFDTERGMKIHKSQAHK